MVGWHVPASLPVNKYSVLSTLVLVCIGGVPSSAHLPLVLAQWLFLCPRVHLTQGGRAMSFNVSFTSRALATSAVSPLRRLSVSLGLAAAMSVLAMAPGAAGAADGPQCELDRGVRFGGMNWESNLVLVEVERFI